MIKKHKKRQKTTKVVQSLSKGFVNCTIKVKKFIEIIWG